MIGGKPADDPAGHRAILAAVAFIIVVAFSYLHPLYQVRSPAHGDQAAYLELAFNLRTGRGFVSRGLSPFDPRPGIEHPESVRGPLYPLLLAPFADQSPAFFLRAKLVTLAISLVVLGVSLIPLAKQEGAWPAAVFALLLAQNRYFEMHAAEVWCENLLLLFCLPAFFLVRPLLEEDARSPLRRGLLAGALLGLGYLTKVSAGTLLFCWAGTVAVVFLRRRPRRIAGPERAGLAGIAGFGAMVLPYLVWNRISVGRFFRDVDLRAAFWLDRGKDYWLAHDTVPGLFSYLDTHSAGDILARLGSGLWRQGWNLADAAAAPYSSGEAVGLLVLGAASIGLACHRGARWKGLQILFLAVSLLLAGWYAPIDVTPRFIYLAIPLILYNAANGLVWLVVRLGGAPSAPVRTAPRVMRSLAAIAGLLLLLHVIRLAQPLVGGGYQVSPAEAETIIAIRQNIGLDDVLCMGPSHQLPYPWLIDRKTVFLPDFDSREGVEAYFDRFQVRGFLLDTDLLLRRPRLLGPHAYLDPVQGLVIRQKLPGLRLVFTNPGPVGQFFLFVRESS